MQHSSGKLLLLRRKTNQKYIENNFSPPKKQTLFVLLKYKYYKLFCTEQFEGISKITLLLITEPQLLTLATTAKEPQSSDKPK